jgi:hypothetical protein
MGIFFVAIISGVIGFFIIRYLHKQGVSMWGSYRWGILGTIAAMFIIAYILNGLGINIY